MLGVEAAALDELLLVSDRLKLLGRPDRIVRQYEVLISEEWRPKARQIYQGHKLQVIAYCLLIEEGFGMRSPFSVVVLAEGKRVEVSNTEELCSKVLSVAAKIRELRREIEQEIPVRAIAAKCRACGQRSNCGQAR